MDLKFSDKARILIVEDSPSDREEWRYLLSEDESKPLDCFQASNGEDALELLDKENISCILLDYNLPDMTGLDFLDQYKKILTHSEEVPVILLTGQGCEEIIVSAMKRGISDYISKENVNKKSLNRSISNAVHRARMAQKLREKQEELDNFTSRVAHDIKAPLRRICQYIYLIEDDLANESNEKMTKWTGKIKSDALFLVQLIEDLLEYSRNIPRSDKKLIPLDLKMILDRAIDNLEDPIQKSNAVVTVSTLPKVNGCETSLVQLFQNIIENGIKYNHSTPPTIRIETQGTLSGPAEVIVQDNGIGMSQEHLDAIFKPFYRLHNRDEYPGSGIGLSTCKLIAEQHKGEIWATSEEGKGTTFHITFPAIPNE